jgi:hypothetical protein
MASSVEVISHWHHSLEDFNTSALDFYRAVEETLKTKEAPAVTTSRVDWHESSVFSAKREYLRISYGRFSFDLCAAPFGKDFFFSWWLVKRGPDMAMMFGCLGVIAVPIVLLISIQIAGFVAGIILFLVLLAAGFGWVVNAARSGIGMVEDTILAIPVLGALYNRFLKPVTYYSTDSRMIFEESVHRIVLDHVATLLTVSKLPPLSAAEAKPEARAALS